MRLRFLDLPDNERRLYIEQAAIQRDVSAVIVEKDFWVSWLLGILFTALPHTLYTNSLAHLKARSVGVIATLLPVYGAVTAAFFLGEIPSTRTLVGGSIILVAVIIETARVLQRKAPTPAALNR